MRVLGLVVLTVVVVACSSPSEEGGQGSGSVTTRPSSTSPASSIAGSTIPTPTNSTSSLPATEGSTSAPPGEEKAPLLGVALEPVGETSFPIVMTARPGDSVSLLGERAGVIREFTDTGIGEIVLDMSSLVGTQGEGGLLGLARHPNDDSRVFVHYTDRNGDTVVSEFPLGLPDALSEERNLLAVDQPAANHNGGMIQFGPDGALYVGLGDGGGGGDRYGNGQNVDTLLGGIVRIDVDTSAAELWQYGLRNPWRFWIDGTDVWIGDVGQSSYEEIDLAPITVSGINYGWPIAEAAHCYRDDPCDTSALTPPLLEIARGDAGTCSITGGVVYGGTAIPELEGRFLFSDYCGGYLRSVSADGTVIDHGVQAGSVVSFGVDGSGEVYVLTPDSVFRVIPLR